MVGGLARIVVAVAGATMVQILLVSSPTATAVVALVLSTFLVGRLVGRRGAITAAVLGCYVLGDHHLADAHGVLGTSSVANTFLLVQVLSIVAGELGHRWQRRFDLDVVLAGLTGGGAPPDGSRPPP